VHGTSEAAHELDVGVLFIGKENVSHLDLCTGLDGHAGYQTVKIGRVDGETVCGWKVVGSTLDSAFEADIQALPDLDRFRHVACYVLILRAKGTA